MTRLAIAAVTVAAVATAGAIGSISGTREASPRLELAGPCDPTPLSAGRDGATVSQLTFGSGREPSEPLAAFARPRRGFDILPVDEPSLVFEDTLPERSRRLARSNEGACLFGIPTAANEVCAAILGGGASCEAADLPPDEITRDVGYVRNGTRYAALFYGLAGNRVRRVTLEDGSARYSGDARGNGYIVFVPETTSDPESLMNRLTPG